MASLTNPRPLCALFLFFNFYAKEINAVMDEDKRYADDHTSFATAPVSGSTTDQLLSQLQTLGLQKGHLFAVQVLPFKDAQGGVV
jgi:hypothetical protein